MAKEALLPHHSYPNRMENMTRKAFRLGAVTFIAAALSGEAVAQNFCFQTAEFLNGACRDEVESAFLVSRATCVNISDRGERSLCEREGRTARTRGRRICQLQRQLRRDTCDLVGQDRFDPIFDPADFETNFSTSRNDFFPLAIGNRSRFEDEEDRVRTVEVLGETRLVGGVTCVVVDERLFLDGVLFEENLGSFAQATNGAVFRCGRQVRGFASFEGDVPGTPELVRTEGSFRAGRNRAKTRYRFSVGCGRRRRVLRVLRPRHRRGRRLEVLSTSFSFGDAGNLDRFVPRRLADLLCAAGDCVVTRRFSLLAPRIETLRFFARGVGMFLEVNPESGETLQLTDCNFDPRCSSLPRP
jgi:hypothetical protein